MRMTFQLKIRSRWYLRLRVVHFPTDGVQSARIKMERLHQGLVSEIKSAWPGNVSFIPGDGVGQDLE